MSTSTVTLDKAYFETLLRRAHFHATDADLASSLLKQTVTIPKADHDSLLATAHQHANLQRNLYRGGITNEALAILIQDDTSENYTTLSAAEGTATATDGGVRLTQEQQTIPSDRGDSRGRLPYTFGKTDSYTPRALLQRDPNTSQGHFLVDEEDAYTQDEPSDAPYDRESANNESIAKPTRQHTTTISDVVDVVRGGLLLDIYLRTYDRTASVSFLEEAHANKFFRYVKRNDLYIQGKRVMIRWSNRQFVLPGHVANKISIGATRNLVIRNRDPNHTEGLIRQDLEHIHNLVVIKVILNGTDAHISTNSVHNALFARTCMMSRAKYKGCKIGWGQDECAVPIQARQQAPKSNAPPKKSPTTPLMNRFQLLNMDGAADDDSQVDDDHNTDGDTFNTTFPSSAVRVVA